MAATSNRKGRAKSSLPNSLRLLGTVLRNKLDAILSLSRQPKHSSDSCAPPIPRTNAQKVPRYGTLLSVSSAEMQVAAPSAPCKFVHLCQSRPELDWPSLLRENCSMGKVVEPVEDSL